MSARTGSTGALEAKGDLLPFNGSEMVRLPVGANGEFLRSQSAEATGLKWEPTSVIAGIGYPISFGASFPNIAAQGRFHHSHGEASSSNSAALDTAAQLACPKNGTITRIAWSTNAASATTVYTIWKNGLVVASVTLTGVSGALATLSVAVLAGDLIALEYDAGTAPVNSGVDLFVE